MNINLKMQYLPTKHCYDLISCNFELYKKNLAHSIKCEFTT